VVFSAATGQHGWPRRTTAHAGARFIADAIAGSAARFMPVPTTGDIVVPGGSFEPGLGSSHYRRRDRPFDLLRRLS